MTAEPGTALRAGEAVRRSALLAPLLRAWREMKGLERADVAALAGCDTSKVSRMEAGTRWVGPFEAKALVSGYGYRGPEFSALVRVIRDDARDWWKDCPGVMTGGFAAYAVLELAAPRIRIFVPAGVPWPLQTPAWALACARHDPAAACGGEETRALTVLARQDAVLGQAHPPAVHALIGARLPDGVITGSDLAEQSEKLASPPPGTVIRFVPDDSAALAQAGPFTILEFDSGPQPAVVCQHGPGGGALITSPDTIRIYTGLFESLDRSARLHRQEGTSCRGTGR